ncbi:MAG: hypothetical protein AAGF85_04505 [Bacteroidota bacterium]
MSREELDKLFRDKLEGISPEPSVESWSTIQARMEEKKGVRFYLRIAAAILLLISFAAFYILNKNYTDAPSRSIAENVVTEPIPHQSDTVKNDSIQIEESKAILNPTEERDSSMDSSQVKNKENKKDAVSKPSLHQNNLATNNDTQLNKSISIRKDSIIQQVNNRDLIPVETLVAENDVTDATSEAEEASSEQNESKSGSTLVFNIEDFDMKSAVTNAYEVAEETKKSGFKKVMDFVKSVKEGEAGLGGLREAKNNLLSIKQKEKDDDNSK